MSRIRARRPAVYAGAAAVLALATAVGVGAPAAGASRASKRAADPSCKFVFYDPSSDAPDSSGKQEDQLDLVQGAFGLSADKTTLRIVMNIKNLSKTIPSGSNFLDYEFFWSDPSGNSGPDAVDVQVDSSGKVTYQDGTETNASGNFQFNASPTSAATGSFGSGPNGAIEADVPLSELKLKPGDVLSSGSAFTSTGVNAQATNVGFIADQDGPGQSYTVGEPTCVDSGSTTSTTTSTNPSAMKRSHSHHKRHRKRRHHKRHHRARR